MSEKTIALSGAEVKVTFSGGNAWLRNDGASAVYAAKTAGVTAGADGVISIPAGGSAPVYGANGTVFLLGSGSVQLVGSDYATNPFKTSTSSGGSAVDEVARTAVDTHAGNAEIHVSADEKALWNGKVDRQSYAPIFSGDMLDIAVMGTYSCSKSDCTNLPQEIIDWCYVTVLIFRDSGYRRYICYPLNNLIYNSGKLNGIIYLASESYKDADGNLIWSRACDGGIAQTISETLPISKGGTGQTTANDAANTLINSLALGNSAPQDDDYYVCQYAGGGEGNTNYYRRPTSKLWEYIKGKAAGEFVSKADYDALAARVAALEAAIIVSNGETTE